MNIKHFRFFFSLLSVLIVSCQQEIEVPEDTCSEGDFFCNVEDRNFLMGFSSWPYAATLESVEQTYKFIEDHSDIYSEHIDSNIPWNAWINGSALPPAFTEDIDSRANKKISGSKLTLSVSLLNSSRNDLAFDYDGNIPDYTALNDQLIEDAYFKHLQYITNVLNPDYLLVAIEVNELLIHAPDKWEAYKLLMTNIKVRMRAEFPLLPMAESITLHNFYQPDVANPEAFIDEIANYINTHELAAISFYPFFKGLSNKEEFQQAFDFLHEEIDISMVFSETSHLSEDLTVSAFDLFIAGNEEEQNDYLKTLLNNAQTQQYEYIVWWAHRDYNELWETFPPEVQDLGKIWLSTGIVNEDDRKKASFESWEAAFAR